MRHLPSYMVHKTYVVIEILAGLEQRVYKFPQDWVYPSLPFQFRTVEFSIRTVTPHSHDSFIVPTETIARELDWRTKL